MDSIDTRCRRHTKEVRGSARVKERFSKTVIYLSIILGKTAVCLGNYRSLLARTQQVNKVEVMKAP